MSTTSVAKVSEVLPSDASPDSTHGEIHGEIGTSLPHESAHLHVTGRANYTDDIPEPRRLLHAAIGFSGKAHAKITRLDLTAVANAPGVVDVMQANQIPGVNNYGPVLADDPIFAPDVVQYVGQPIFVVVADDVDQARRAVQLADVEYTLLPAILDLREAVRKQSFVLPSETITTGDSKAAMGLAQHRLTGQVTLGGQDQFYLEGHIAMAVPQEDNNMLVYSSTQHPSEVQHIVAMALNRRSNDIVVQCRRMGGAFGGKESQPALIACIAALMANKTQRPVKLRLDRDTDMIVTGKRHDFVIDYAVGFDQQGLLNAVEITYSARCGMSADLSGAINDRTMFHTDNAYFLKNATIVSHRCKTNTVSNTAFRGFGGPQGMFAIEYIVDDIARYLGVDPLHVRRKNFYGHNDRNITPYKQVVEDNVIEEIFSELEASSDYKQRRLEIDAWNKQNTVLQRGLAITPVKFGISFTTTHLNQAGALLHIYSDGTVYLNHGGTEMGQGLFTKVAQVVAHELQIDVDRIKVSASDTSKVPNASATAASSGSDINGKAAQIAANKIKQRLARFACEHFGVAIEEVRFHNNQVYVGETVVEFTDLIMLAYLARTSLSATGFYATPKIHYDRATFSGRPFYYFAYGAAVSEVVVDTLTGENRIVRVDILHDCGKSLNPAIDLGQIEGGFVQGAGWLTTEELCWNMDGELTTHAPSTYKIPTSADVPVDFRVSMRSSPGNAQDTIHRSKAVGEPPLMLALSVFFALRDALSSAQNLRPNLHAPATPESLLCASEGPGEAS